MVATSSTRFNVPLGPSLPGLIQQARELILLGYYTQSVATCRTALETAACELSMRHNIRASKPTLNYLVQAVAKYLGWSKTKRSRLRYVVTMLNAAAHGCPSTAGDAAAVVFAIEPIIDAAVREGVQR